MSADIEAGAKSGVLSPTHARAIAMAHEEALAAKDRTIAELRARIRELEGRR